MKMGRRRDGVMGRQKNFGLRSAEKKETYPYFCEHRAERYFWEKPILFLFLIQISRADTNSDIYTTKKDRWN
jgi:hypothetical protein